MASAGAQIQGSWANKIGSEAEAVVKRMLITECYERDMIDSFVSLKGKTITNLKPNEMVEQLPSIRGARLRNQTSIIFSSEPDLSLIGPDARLVGVIEIKGGKDANGALERFGAAKKSFDEAMKQNAKVKRVFVASCITPEVEQRIKHDKTFQHTFNLTRILRDERDRATFLNLILNILDRSAQQK
jgi:XcyI restriction endonuclease